MKRMYLILGLCLGLNALQASQLTLAQKAITSKHADRYCENNIPEIKANVKSLQGFRVYVGYELTKVRIACENPADLPTDEFDPTSPTFLDKVKRYIEILKENANPEAVFMASYQLPISAGDAKNEILTAEAILPNRGETFFRDQRFLGVYIEFLQRVLTNIK